MASSVQAISVHTVLIASSTFVQVQQDLWLPQSITQKTSKPCCICVQVLLQTVANAGCNGLHEANFEAWQKLCDEINMCKQLEAQQHFLLHIITEALAPDKGARLHQVCHHAYVTSNLTFPLNTPQCLSLMYDDDMYDNLGTKPSTALVSWMHPYGSEFLAPKFCFSLPFAPGNGHPCLLHNTEGYIADTPSWQSKRYDHTCWQNNCVLRWCCHGCVGSPSNVVLLASACLPSSRQGKHRPKVIVSQLHRSNVACACRHAFSKPWSTPMATGVLPIAYQMLLTLA